MAEVPDLKADCSKCIALCCVVFPFDPSDDFAVEKPAGAPCRHLSADHTCTIHATLTQQGMRGCTLFDCLGAGQRLTQEVLPDLHWRDGDAALTRITDAFRVLRRVHELIELMILTERLSLTPDQKRERQEILDQLTPMDGWSEDSLQSFARTGLEPRTQQFLGQLRDQVAR